MKRFRVIVLVLWYFFSVSVLFGGSVPINHLVSVKWLHSYLHSRNLLIVDLRSPEKYRIGHIPGAINIPKHEYFQKGKLGSIFGLMDPPQKITELFESKGISAEKTIVLYDSAKSPKNVANATRVLWTMWVYGLKNVAILGGGIEAWKDKGYRLSKRLPRIKPTKFKFEFFHSNVVATWLNIYEYLVLHDAQLIDTRTSKYFIGRDEDKRLKKHGHIPGARLISLKMFLKKEGNYFIFKDGMKIRKLLKNKGVEVNKPIIVFCNTGHLASGAWFAIKFLAGAEDVKMYDASMVGYSRMPLPVQR